MSETERSATEILGNTPKAFTMLLTGLRVVQERLEWVAGAEAKEARAKQAEAEAGRRKDAADAEAVAVMRDATSKAEQTLSAAKVEAKRVLDEAAVIAADNDRLRGETGDLQATKTKLLSDVQRLTNTVADLEAIR